MDNIAIEILTAVNDVNRRIEALLRSLDFAELPSIPLESLISCDDIAPGISCLYFLMHPIHGLLYVGKAKDLRQRWRASGFYPGEERSATHQYHERCIELGDVCLSWLPLDETAHEIAETIAIRCFEPHWNVRKSKHGYETPAGVPSRHLKREGTLEEWPDSVLDKLRNRKW